MGVQFAGNILVQSNGGPLPISQGGTGQTTAPTAINALLPTQAGQSGKYLTTNGTNVSWATTGGGAAGGSDTQIQYNDSGNFGGSANLVINKSTGALTSLSTLTNTGLLVSNTAGTFRSLKLQTAGLDRWLLQANNVSESGSNVGSNFEFVRVADNGLTQNQVFTVARSSGVVDFKVAPTVNGEAIGGAGAGTVTSVSVTTANGVSGTVATSTTTPAITLTLGAITPTSVAASGSISAGPVASSARPPLTVSNGGSNVQFRIEGSGGAAYYDIGRNDATGVLTFTGSQAGFVGYRFTNQPGAVLFDIDRDGTNVNPGVHNTRSLGTSAIRWSNVYATTLTGALTGTATGIAGGTAGAVVYQSAASTTATLPIGTVGKVLTSTGTVPAWSAPIYDLALSINGKPTNSATVLAFTAVRAFTLPSSYTGSVAKSNISATASTVFTVNKNGTSIGSITFAAAATTGTFSGAGGTFAVSDLLTIVAPASPDSTLANIGITLVAQLT